MTPVRDHGPLVLTVLESSKITGWTNNTPSCTAKIEMWWRSEHQTEYLSWIFYVTTLKYKNQRLVGGSDHNYRIFAWPVYLHRGATYDLQFIPWTYVLLFQSINVSISEFIEYESYILHTKSFILLLKAKLNLNVCVIWNLRGIISDVVWARKEAHMHICVPNYQKIKFNMQHAMVFLFNRETIERLDFL